MSATPWQEIRGAVRKHYDDSQQDRDPFEPGKTRINYAGRVFDSQEILNLVDASMEFWLTSGKYTDRFEKEIGKYTGTTYNLFVNSGSSANLLALYALRSPYLPKKRQMNPGDEVITTAMCFPTTIAPIVQMGAIPVFVDVLMKDGNIDTSKIEEAITDRTKAISVAHTLGVPINTSEITSICRKHNLWFLEDNCDALGSQVYGKPTGSFGDISTCSFYPAHHITTGEGGMVCTNDPKLYRIIKSMRDWGRDCTCNPGQDNQCGNRFEGTHGTLPKGYDHKYVYSHLGFNLKATDLQAAIGCAQLEKLDTFTAVRRRNHRILSGILESGGTNNHILVHYEDKGSVSSWFGCLIIFRHIDPGIPNRTKQGLVEFLESRNIQTRNLFAGNITRHPCFEHLVEGKDYRISGELSMTDKLMNDALWIGVYPGMTDEMLDYMAWSIREYLGT